MCIYPLGHFVTHGLPLFLRREQERLRLEAETADSDDSFMGVLDYKYGSTGLNSKGQVCVGGL